MLNNAPQRTGWDAQPLAEDAWREAVRCRPGPGAWNQALGDVQPFLDPPAGPCLFTPENPKRIPGYTP